MTDRQDVMRPRVAVLGECMIEFAPADHASFKLGFGGDTLNTAVYLSRYGVDVAYVTAIGASDPFSEGVIELLRKEAIDTSLIIRKAGTNLGLYVITNDAAGERNFSYWRDNAPIRSLLASESRDAVLVALTRPAYLYFSGISLAVIGSQGRAALLAALQDAGAKRPRIAIDVNYRASLWESGGAAATALAEFFPLCDFISFGTSEGRALFGDQFKNWLGQLVTAGAEVVLRNEDLSTSVFSGSGMQRFGNDRVVVAIDTTAAGDGFNAAYLATRWRGGTVEEAVDAAQALAAVIVGHRGAIIPYDETSSGIGRRGTFT